MDSRFLVRFAAAAALFAVVESPSVAQSRDGTVTIMLANEAPVRVLVDQLIKVHPRVFTGLFHGMGEYLGFGGHGFGFGDQVRYLVGSLRRLSLPPLCRTPGRGIQERCRSGRTGLSRKQKCSQGHRGFESLPLRQRSPYLVKVGLLCRRAALFMGHWSWDRAAPV